jgi:hypothetical protein
MSSGEVCGEGAVQLAGDVAFEATDDVLFGLSLAGAAFGVVTCAFVTTQTREHDGVKGAVGAAVTAAVEPVAAGFAGGCFDGVDAAERGERRFAGESVRVVARGDEQG